MEYIFNSDILSHHISNFKLNFKPNSEVKVYYLKEMFKLNGDYITHGEKRFSNRMLKYGIYETADFYIIRIYYLIDFIIYKDGIIKTYMYKNFSYEEINRYLQGIILGFIFYINNYICFHSTAVVKDDCLIIIMGESGAGKSTLAYYLASNGFKMLTDDILCYSSDNGFHGFKKFYLDDKTLSILNLDIEKDNSIKTNVAKYVEWSEYLNIDKYIILYLKKTTKENLSIEKEENKKLAEVLKKNTYPDYLTYMSIDTCANNLCQKTNLYTVNYYHTKNNLELLYEYLTNQIKELTYERL